MATKKSASTELVLDFTQKVPITSPEPVEVPETLPVIECCCCSEAIESADDQISHGSDVYCCNCHDEHFIYCEQCHSYGLTEDAVCPGSDDTYCSERCARRAGWSRCNDCQDWHRPEDSGYTDDNGESICESCHDDNYSCCDNCGESAHHDDIINGYCSSCYGRNRNRVIKSYDFNPREFLFMKMPWENTVYLGIELEVECDHTDDRTELAEKLIEWLDKRKLKDRVYIKEDGSLEHGFEIVFMPCTLQAMHKKFPMREFLRYAKRIGLTSHEEGTCGLHVHISRQDMTARDVWAGKLFFWKCQTQIGKLSERDGNFNFCKFDEQMPKNDQNEHGRYSALNTSTNGETIEVRVFRGTLNYDRFQASMQFTDLFAEYIQQVSVTTLKKKTSGVVWGEFLAFAKQKNKYQQFLTYCKTKGIR